MKVWKLKEVHGKTHKESGVHVLQFMFEPEGAIIGLSTGKNITVKIGIGAKMPDVCEMLVKAAAGIHEELKKA
jgi:hypothetical protein